MTNNETFYRQKKLITGVSSFAVVTSSEVLDCFHGSEIEPSRKSSWDTNKWREKLLFILVLMLAFSYRCYASDTTSVLVHFAFDKYSLNNNAKRQLNQLAMDTSGTLTNIKVYGFTDQAGSHAYNKKLSVKRAIQVSNYLIKAGVRLNTITLVQGKGETELVSVQMNKSSMQQNRRVLVIITYEAKVDGQATHNNGSRKKDSTKVSKQQTEPPALIDQIKDNKVKAGDQIILRNINFEGGRHVFLPQSYGALMDLLNTMKQIPTLKIEIQGHICCVQGTMDGPDNDLGSLDLSVQRAKAVYNYLVENGIKAARMSYEGFGHQYPITQEQSEEDKTINRRVEIKIISK